MVVNAGEANTAVLINVSWIKLPYLQTSHCTCIARSMHLLALSPTRGIYPPRGSRAPGATLGSTLPCTGDASASWQRLGEG